MRERLLQYAQDHWLALTLWAVVLGVAAYFLVRRWARIRQFLIEVREELKKCSWPTWTELRGSTWVVAVTVLVLGVFVACADVFFSNALHALQYGAGTRSEWLIFKR